MSLRRGFSLLEVILATTILLGAVVVLGELSRLGLRNARSARDWSAAERICDNLMAEMTAGAELPEPVEHAPLPTAPGWLYTLEREPTAHPAVMLVQLTVRQDLPPEKHAVECTLVRWMRKPAGMTLDGVPEAAPGYESGATFEAPPRDGEARP